MTITKYKGVDPEVPMSGLDPGVEGREYYPKTRDLYIGHKCNFLTLKLNHYEKVNTIHSIDHAHGLLTVRCTKLDEKVYSQLPMDSYGSN